MLSLPRPGTDRSKRKKERVSVTTCRMLLAGDNRPSAPSVARRRIRELFFEAACYVPLARNPGERSAALLESFHTRSDRLLPEERPEEVWIAKSCPASKTNDDKVLRGRNINALTVRADHGYEVGRCVL